MGNNLLQVRKEAKYKATKQWYGEIISIHNDFVFRLKHDTEEYDYIMDKLNNLMEEMLVYMKENI